MRINVVTVYVTDQDKAKAFYTKTLGFTLRDDAPYGPGFRWLTVVSPEDEHVELYLAHQDRYPGAPAYRQAMYDAGTPVIGFAVDDLDRVHQALAAQGSPSPASPPRRSTAGTARASMTAAATSSTCTRRRDRVLPHGYPGRANSTGCSG